MKIAEFKDILNRLEELYAAAGATGQAEDLRRVKHLLEGSENRTVQEFVAETKALLLGQPAPDRMDGEVDEERVATHARRLLDAGTDQRAFQAALEALDGDKRLGKAEWFLIANQYRNSPTGGTHIYRYSTIKAARAAIRDVFIERFESEGKRGIIGRMTRWAS